MKNGLNLLLVCILLALLALSGCSQMDSAVGIDLVPGLNDVYPEEKIVYPVASAFYQDLLTTGSSPYLYLGHMQDYDAHVLLKFIPYAALPDSYAVDSLVVKLFLDSVITAGSDPLVIDVIPVNYSQTWAEVGVTWDNLDSLQLGDSWVSFEVPAAPADSDSFSFSLPAPDSLLHAWESAGSGGKTLHYNNGVYLQTQPPYDHMVRFSSAEYSQLTRRPKLEMYVTVFDTSDTTGAEPVDSMIYLYAGADAFVARYTGQLDSSCLYIGNAVVYRTILQFDLEGLFPSYGIGVHRAEFVLHADTTHELNLGQIEAVFHQEMQDLSWQEDPANAPIKFVTPIFGVYDEEEATLSIVLNQMVFGWINDPASNHGFMIKSASELVDINRTVFYGIDAPDSLRPCLRLVYIENAP